MPHSPRFNLNDAHRRSTHRRSVGCDSVGKTVIQQVARIVCTIVVVVTVALPALSQPAGAGGGQTICCDNLPAHTRNLQNTLELICAPKLHDKTVTPNANILRLRTRLDELVHAFEDELWTSSPADCKLAQKDGIHSFVDDTLYEGKDACVTINQIWPAAQKAVLWALAACQPAPPEEPASKSKKDDPIPCPCPTCCKADGPLDLSPPYRELNLWLSPDPQVPAQTFAGLTSIQVVRPGILQLAGADVPIVLGPPGAAIGFGAVVQPYGLVVEARMQKYARTMGALFRAAGPYFARKAIEGLPPAPSEEEDQKQSAAALERVDANTPLGAALEQIGYRFPADVKGAPKIPNTGLQYLAECVDDAESILKDMVSSKEAGRALEALRSQRLDDKALECPKLIADHWEKGLKDTLDNELVSAVDELTNEVGNRQLALEGSWLKRYGSCGEVIGRSFGVSASGGSPGDGLSTAFGPDRVLNVALSLDVLNTKDPLVVSTSRDCVRRKIDRLRAARYGQAQDIINDRCTVDDGGAIGLGVETSIRYQLPTSLTTTPDVAVQFGGFGGWLNAEYAREGFAITGIGQTGAELNKDGSGLVWRGATGGLRITVGAGFGSLALDGNAGVYATERGLVTADTGVHFDPHPGGEGGIQATLALPLGLSLSAGGNFRCIVDADCDARFIGGVGWVQQPGLVRLIAEAAGRGHAP